jgi:RAD50-interacting protein 1
LHVNNALSTARDLLVSAREASLARHTVVDDLASLTNELVSVASRHGTNTQQPLLEDLEGLHKKLEELEMARTYVQIIQRATQLRYILDQFTHNSHSVLIYLV